MYLGAKMRKDGGATEDINSRLNKAKAKKGKENMKLQANQQQNKIKIV
jgi:hypothetical protein